MHRRPADDDRRSAPVIAYRHVFVVRQKGIIGAKHLSDVRSVMYGRIEIGVVAYRDWQVELGQIHRDENALPNRPCSCADVGTRAQQLAQPRPKCGSLGHIERHQRIERGAPTRDRRRCSRKQAGGNRGCYIENRVTDGHSHLRGDFNRAGAPENSERQVLNREIGLR